MLLGISLFLRFSFAVLRYASIDTAKFRDSWDYMRFARQMVEQGFWVLDISSVINLRMGPGYPFLLSIIIRFFGEHWLPVFFLNAVLSGFVPVMVYFLTKSLCNSAKPAIIAAIWTAFYFPSISFVAMGSKENMMMLLFTSFIYFLVKLSQDQRILYGVVWVPILFLVLIHTDERFFVYLIFFPLVLMFQDKKLLKLNSIKLGVTISLIILGMIPWLIRNYIAYGEFVFLTPRADFAIERFLGVTDRPMDWGGLTNQWDLDEEQIQKIKTGEETYNRHPTEIKLIQEGKLEPHRYSTWERHFYQTVEFWRACRYKAGYIGSGFRFQLWGWAHNIIWLSTYGILLPFLIIGVFYSVGRFNRIGIVLVLVFIAHTLTHVLFAWVRNRYRLPMDGMIISMSAYGLYCLRNRISIFSDMNGAENQQ